MRKIGRVLVWGFLILLVLAAVGVTFTIGWRPFIGPRARATTARTFERTPERIARGQYLVQHVSGCMDCHTPHDWSATDAPIIADKMGAGEELPLVGLPGHVFAPNITPDPETGAGNWTDDQLARAIREGVGHDGRALFPLMPYQDFRSMSDEDLASVVVYLRSLPPVRNTVPTTALIFPVNYLIRAVPQPLDTPVPPPDVSTPLKRGTYMVTMAGCADCHTPQDAHGNPLPGMDFAGGFILEGPFGRVASANLTPDPSGIPYYSEAQFIQTLRTGSMGARKLNPIMPSFAYQGMTDEDIVSIFAYLKSVPPVNHHVDNTEPAKYCKKCKTSHGDGDKN